MKILVGYDGSAPAKERSKLARNTRRYSARPSM